MTDIIPVTYKAISNVLTAKGRIMSEMLEGKMCAFQLKV